MQLQSFPRPSRRFGFSAMISHPDAGELDRQIPLFAAAGFDTWFLACGVTADFARIPAWSALSRREGVELEAVHAPTDGVNALWSTDPSDESAVAAYMSRARALLELCSEGGVDKLVLHVSYGGAEAVSDLGLIRFAQLEAYATACGVRLCYENAGIAAHLFAVVENASAGHGFCFDAGHELCYTPDAGYLPRLGGRLLYTHLHDNRGGYASASGQAAADEHLLPYDGVRDWSRLGGILASIGYGGTLNAELACLYRPDYAALSYPAFLSIARERLARLDAEIEAAASKHPEG